MATRHAWRNDKRLTAMMVEDMQFDPILAAKVLLGIKLPPHQELRVLTMWTTSWTNDDSGFSTGKTANNAIVAALRSILFPNRISGMLSKTFAQGKLAFAYFDKWANSNSIFRSCIRVKKGNLQIIHDTSCHFVDFRGSSQIRVLPPDFMKDSERLRGERWNDGYFDEWTTFGNMLAFNKTVIGRVTSLNHYPDCPVRMNHIHLSSTPGFMHDPPYSLIKKIQRNIAAGSQDYARFTSNYRHIPKTNEWKFLVNYRTIFHMQTTLNKSVVRAEVDGLWQKDSGSYYLSSSIASARYSGSTLVKKRLISSEVFVAGVDVARGGGNASSGAGDDFAITVIRIVNGVAHQCRTVRKNGITDTQMSGIIHGLHKEYGFSLIAFDPGGGGLFLEDKLKLSTQLIDNVPTTCTPIVKFGESTVIGNSILVPVRRSDFWVARKWGKMSSDSVLLNRMHKELRDAIDSKRLILSGPWNGWGGDHSQWDPTAKRIWLMKNYRSMKQDDIDNAELDLCVSQLILIDIAKDSNGIALLDSHSMYQFGSKSKKDSAYSLLYAWLAKMLFDIALESGMTQTATAGTGRKLVFAASPI